MWSFKTETYTTYDADTDRLWNAGHEHTFTWHIGPADFIEFANPFSLPNSQVLLVCNILLP